MKKTIVFFTLCMLSLPLFSQNASDALRYSQVLYGGTARFQGLAGAMGAIGADFSVISTNPGGLGLFKSSEVSITPSFWNSNTKAEFNGMTTTDNKFNFAMGNIGVVISMPMDKRKSAGGLKNLNFAFGINRQNNFNNHMVIMGQNYKSSMLTDWVNVLDGRPGITDAMINTDYPFDIALALNSGLIYYDSAANKYANDAPNGGVYQIKSITTSGSMNEFDFAIAANINDKLYFGATIGIPWLRYHESSEYTEDKINENIPYFRTLTFDQVLDTRATGINFKVGMVYRPANWVRIGAAIHTPTFYGTIRDNWYSSMYAGYDSAFLENNTQYSPDGHYDYLLSTPFRAIGSIAFIIGPYGLISAEYEYANYNQARFHDRGNVAVDSYSDLNTLMKDSYKSPVNLRFGTEWRIADFRLRGGFGYISSPYKNSINTGERILVSGGVGYRGQHIFADLTYVWSRLIEQYYMYDPAFVDPSNNAQRSSSVMMTWGVRF